MKAVTYTTFGDPAAVLQTTDVARPEPKAGEALIRMVLSPIHNHDLWTVRGNYGFKPELPAIGGTEALGVVEAAGDGVDAALIGKRVVNVGKSGAWAEYFTAPAAGLLPLPDSIPDTAGAQLIAMPFSALALLEFLEASKGDWVIQTAANGAVGKIFADLARARGINTINLVRRNEAVAELEALGMEHVLSTSEEDWQKRARAILGDKGAQAAIDSVGGPIVADIANLLGVNGLLVVFGTATGVPLQLHASAMITNHLVVKGFWGSRIIAEMPQDEKTRLITELVGLAAQGKLHLPAGGEFKLDQVVDAVKASLTPGRTGKILLRA
ncbi:zinc-binding dehydrogenase [Hoeflea sp.]|uniref:zinc-binding dehydrogenase n=1 Tax=Hoeflea sp. TaxID=1940281 RepID=UPI003A8E36DE